MVQLSLDSTISHSSQHGRSSRRLAFRVSWIQQPRNVLGVFPQCQHHLRLASRLLAEWSRHPVCTLWQEGEGCLLHRVSQESQVIFSQNSLSSLLVSHWSLLSHMSIPYPIPVAGKHHMLIGFPGPVTMMGGGIHRAHGTPGTGGHPDCSQGEGAVLSPRGGVGGQWVPFWDMLSLRSEWR